MQQHAATFLDQAEDAAGAELPQFVKDEFDAFLEWVSLAYGFLPNELAMWFELAAGQAGAHLRWGIGPPVDVVKNAGLGPWGRPQRIVHMSLYSLYRAAALVAVLAAPLSGQAGIVLLNFGGALSGQDGHPPAGTMIGWLNYESDTGVVSSARILVSLFGTDDPFELTLIDPDANVIAKDGDKPKPPVIIRDNVDGESSEKDHKNMAMLIPTPPNPVQPVVNFTGTFFNRIGGDPSTTTTYSVRGTAALAVPEPTTLALVMSALAATGLARRRVGNAQR